MRFYIVPILCFVCISLVLCLNDSTAVTDVSSDSPSTKLTSITDRPTATPTVTPENISCEAHIGKCEDCVKNKKCYYCHTDKKCKPYKVKELIPIEECKLDEINYLTCKFNFEVMMILIGVGVGIVLLAIIIGCCYCCCKRKGIRISKDDLKWARQSEERKVRAAEKKKERAARTDEIRRKYGLMKDDTPYQRFDA